MKTGFRKAMTIIIAFVMMLQLSITLFAQDSTGDYGECDPLPEVERPGTDSPDIFGDVSAVKVSKTSGKAGKTVSIDVSIEDNPGIWGLALKVVYDRDMLTLINVENGTVFSNNEWTQGSLTSNNYVLYFEESSFTDNDTDGVIATLVFEISEDAETGDFAEVSVSYNVGDIINADLEDIIPEIVSGGVNVNNIVYGDINGDDVVNTKDSYILVRYLVGSSSDIDAAAADVYHDGVVNTKDSLQLKRYLAGVIGSLDPEPEDVPAPEGGAGGGVDVELPPSAGNDGAHF